MALEGVLANIPGLAGYLASQQYDQRRALGSLQGLGQMLQMRQEMTEAPLRQQMRQAQLSSLLDEQEQRRRAQAALADAMQRFGPREETIAEQTADDEMTGTPGQTTQRQVQRPMDMEGFAAAIFPTNPGIASNMLNTAEAARGRREAQVQAAQSRLAELQMRLQDQALSREQRAQLQAQAEAARRDMLQMQLDSRRDMANLAASMRQPPAPSPVTIMRNGVPTVIDARTGQSIGEAPPRPTDNKPLTEFQGKAMLYGTRAAESHNILNSLEDDVNLRRLAAGQMVNNLPIVGRMIGSSTMSPEAQKIDQAQRNFVNAVLRQESGAVISDQEFANAQKQYFPQPGDDKATIEQKRKNRELAIAGFKRMAGPAGADIDQVLADTRQGPPRIKTDEEYAKLPSGAEYISPDGQRRRKQ